MLHESETAKFISDGVGESKKSPSQIATEVGIVDFTHIMAGTTQLSLRKVGIFDEALHMDSVIY